MPVGVLGIGFAENAMKDKYANELPVSCDIAWYGQKAVTVLLVLLFLGV